MSKKAVRLQRFVMGTLLSVALALIYFAQSKFGYFLLIFIIFMLYVSAFTGFCPSDIVFEKLVGEKKENKS